MSETLKNDLDGSPLKDRNTNRTKSGFGDPDLHGARAKLSHRIAAPLLKAITRGRAEQLKDFQKLTEGGKSHNKNLSAELVVICNLSAPFSHLVLIFPSAITYLGHSCLES